MQKNNLVSIMVPVYQAENYVSRCIESVLNQTFKNIELILINDGSKDKTESVILSYLNQFEECGMRLIYAYQQNNGQASAINNALKRINGAYVAWFDSDDELMPTFVEDMLNAIEKSDGNYAISQLIMVDDKEKSKTKFVKKRIKPDNNDNFFMDLIFEKNIVYGSGCCLVKTDFLFSRLKGKTIYESKEGQNWQLMLPISYNENPIYVDKPLCKIIERVNSHSRQLRNKNEQIKRIYSFEQLIIETIERMWFCLDKEDIIRKVKIKYSLQLFEIAFSNEDKCVAELSYKKLCSLGYKNKKIDKKYKYLCASKNLFKYNLFMIIRKIRMGLMRLLINCKNKYRR